VARSFVRANSQYLQNATIPAVTALPLTVSLWYYPTTDITDDQELFSITDNTTGYLNALRFSISWSQSTWTLSTRLSGLSQSGPVTSSMPVQNQWNNLVGTLTSGSVGGSNNGTLYVNGTVPMQSLYGTASLTIPNLVNTNIGAYLASNGPIVLTQGYIANVAVWNVDLNAQEASALWNGAQPYEIRQQNLAGFWPLDGFASPEPDLSGNGINLTLSNSPVQAPTAPPITQITPKRRVFTAASSGGAVYTISAVEGTYALTGKTQALNASRSVSLTHGSYTSTGEAITFNQGQGLAASTGSYGLTGKNSTLSSGVSITAAEGVYSVTGHSPTLGYTTNTLPSGSYVLTGEAQKFQVALSCQAQQGTYTLTGRPQVLAYNKFGSGGGQAGGHKFIADCGNMSEQNL
jgi:hypothetical protein